MFALSSGMHDTSPAPPLDDKPDGIYLIAAHPHWRESRVNRRMLAAASGVPGVTVCDLYGRYPDYHIDVAAEQAKVAAARMVVLMHPIQWYATPPLQKLWFDEVLTWGWAYGTDGNALRGKDLWLGLRPPEVRPIASWEVSHNEIVKPPKGTTHVVLDTPGGLHGSRFKEVMKLADKVIVPLQPSVFDIFATRDFLDELVESRHAKSLQIGLVGMRVDARTIAADKLQEFVQTLGLPVLGMLRNTQNYLHLAAHGLTIFDVAPARVAKDLEQWQPVCAWLDR